MWDEEKHCPAPKLHGQQWSGWQDTKSSTTQTTRGEESWWFPYSTHSMKSPFWILTPQSSKSTGRSWVSHGSPAIQGSEVLSRGPAPSPLKSNVMGERGMLLQGWQVWVPSHKQAFLQGTKHTWTLTLLTWNWVVPTGQLSQGWGSNSLASDRSHMTPLTWNGLVAEGVSAEAHVTWQTPEHYGEQGGPGCSGKSWKSNFFLLFL